MPTRLFLAALLALGLATTADAAQLSDEETARASREVVFAPPLDSDAAIARLRAGGGKETLPALALAMRYRRLDPLIIEGASGIAGEPILDWGGLMTWIEAHPEYPAHPSYRDIKLEVLSRIDPAFMRFLGGERSLPENMDIRLEEIVWGGVRVDGIPALDDPKLIPVGDAAYLKDDDLVFGIEINGDARAYPLRIMGWHEMFNETIGGVPVALAYCTLCGAAILYETQIEGRAAPLVFGSSGFLYRSNKLMFDRETDSLWNQFTGKPVMGPLRGSGIELKIRPVATMAWADWKRLHPDTQVLSLETGYDRDYGSGVVYREYFASPDLMFPAIVGDESVAKRKDFVFGVLGVGAARAWPVAAFANEPVINDAVGVQNLVLVGDAATRTVRAYARGDRTFMATDRPGVLKTTGGEWLVTEDALTGPDGARLPRVAGRLGYWFAWNNYYGVESTLYGADD